MDSAVGFTVYNLYIVASGEDDRMEEIRLGCYSASRHLTLTRHQQFQLPRVCEASSVTLNMHNHLLDIASLPARMGAARQQL
jgi:hypothetical protein